MAALPGKYTRYGDVLELLKEPDDACAILAPGDEIDLEYDLSQPRRRRRE